MAAVRPWLLLYYTGWGCQPGPVRPRIRYCSTLAGRVAYSTSGAGPALLCDSGWITDLRRQLELYSFGSFIERLAERFTVIRYDKPGCGLSDRGGIDLSFDGQVAAALAVADAVGADRFCLFGASQGGQVAAAITAWYPERVEACQGYAAQVQAITAANPRPSPRRGTVPPGAQVVLDQLAAYGTCDQVREQLQPWDRAADIVTILLPPGMPWHNIEATLQAAAPGARPGRAEVASPPQSAAG
jgi:pimeloyl-ACP methyl ester carboxylesterase